MGRGRHSPWSSICFHCRPGFNCSCKLKKSGPAVLTAYFWNSLFGGGSPTLWFFCHILRTYLSSTFWSDSSGCSFVLLALRLPPFSPCRWNYLSLFHQPGFNEEKRIFGRASAHSFTRCFDPIDLDQQPSIIISGVSCLGGVSRDYYRVDYGFANRRVALAKLHNLQSGARGGDGGGGGDDGDDFGDGGDGGAENNWCPGSRCRSNRKGLWATVPQVILFVHYLNFCPSLFLNPLISENTHKGTWLPRGRMSLRSFPRRWRRRRRSFWKTPTLVWWVALCR